ncbi:MAG TPA: helix-turn-helix transcriptional regulator [Streptosporangiaceae bacterium]|nr:helix-turn-helix transcriptional regulator [Streptosporangiaceae bacterium]
MTAGPARTQVSYQWRLREIMASRSLLNATDLEPLLAERGITPVLGTGLAAGHPVPERLSLPVLAALCDIRDATPADLITNQRPGRSPRQAAGGAVTP